MAAKPASEVSGLAIEFYITVRGELRSPTRNRVIYSINSNACYFKPF